MMNEKLKILHIADSREEGGRSSYTVDLVKALNLEGCENFLLTSEKSEIKTLSEHRSVAVKVVNKITTNKILNFADETRSGILHFHDSDVYDYLPSHKVAKRNSVKTIVDLHRYDWRKKHFPFQRTLMKADLMIASTIKERNFTHDIPFPVERVVIVHKPVNALRFNQTISPRPILAAFNVPPEIMLIGTVARLDDTMNYRLWADTIELIIGKYADIEFLVVGEGERKTGFQNLLKNRGLGNKVMFTGFRKDIPQIIAAMDIYFHPTFEDLVHYSVLEAMAVGKPVVSPNLSSIREMFVNGRNGLFFDIESSESASNLISKFKDDSAAQAIMVKNNTEDTMDKYSIKKAAVRILETYKKLIKE